jgi:dissimilatory sulfite reductase (desulfoviridin) alpha/beta subunit
MEEAEKITEKVINYYNENGQKGERFADTVDRIGFESVQEAIFNE